MSSSPQAPPSIPGCAYSPPPSPSSHATVASGREVSEEDGRRNASTAASATSSQADATVTAVLRAHELLACEATQGYGEGACAGGVGPSGVDQGSSDGAENVLTDPSKPGALELNPLSQRTPGMMPSEVCWAHGNDEVKRKHNSAPSCRLSRQQQQGSYGGEADGGVWMGASKRGDAFLQLREHQHARWVQLNSQHAWA